MATARRDGPRDREGRPRGEKAAVGGGPNRFMTTFTKIDAAHTRTEQAWPSG